jgi:hypothetical protein
MAKRGTKTPPKAKAEGVNGLSETEKIQKKMADKRAKKTAAAPAPEVRDLEGDERAQARIILLENQLMTAKKRNLELEAANLKLQQANLELRAQAHNQQNAQVTEARNEFVRSIGADPEADKVDLTGDRVTIQRGVTKA